MSRLKMHCGADIELQYYMTAYEQIAVRFGSYKAMEDQRQDPETRISCLIRLASIFADSAELHNSGRHTEYTEEWLKNNLRPVDMPGLSMSVDIAFAEAMGMDTEGEANDKPRDLVLENIEKKTDGE